MTPCSDRSVTILYFAALREAVATEREVLSLPDEVNDVAALRAWLRHRGPTWAEALADSRPIRVAVDQSMAGDSTAIAGGAEVAFFPPVTGG